MDAPVYFYIYTPQPYLENENHVILYYHGPFNNTVIARMAQELRANTACLKHTGWKVFSIFVEMVQNIYFHTIEYNIGRENEPVGIVFVEEHADTFKITAANLAGKASLELLEERCEAINQMNHQELRAYKNELLADAVDNQQKGGNIGLVQVAMLSQEKINFEIRPINQHNGLFTLVSTIKKHDDKHGELIATSH